MSVPLILLTDFGWRDPYVGQVKGMVQRVAPGTVIIDLCHDLPPFAISAGSWLLERVLTHMPEPAVWLCVVDPGVGTARRPLALELGSSRFVGPDNGLFTPLLQGSGHRVVAIDPHPYGPLSHTFHGRDLFAPAAGRLLRGEPLGALGPTVTDPLIRPVAGWEGDGAGGWRGEVMLVDRFGNLITGLPGEMVAGRRGVRGWAAGVSCGPLVNTFGELAVGEMGLLVGSFGTLEVVVNQGSAARMLGIGPGARVEIRPSAGEAQHSP